MRADRASRTAHFVTLGRALADAGISHISDFRDPTARFFLTDRGKRSLAKTERSAREGKRKLSVELARGMGDMMALRTLAIDAAIRDAIASGVTQLVILGAGYDGRAWRMSELEGVEVFEVDHPATQDDKRARLSELPSTKASVTFVSIDFETESLRTVLRRAGHNPSSPTCWIWEGVVMYLTQAAMRTTLETIRDSSALGSTLIVNYHSAHRRLLARLMFSLIGEPQISAWSRAEMESALRSAGFVVVDDSNMGDWNDRFAQGKAKVDRGLYMRIAIGRKQER